MKTLIERLIKLVLILMLGTGGLIVIIEEITRIKLNLQNLDTIHSIKMNIVEPVLIVLIIYLFILWMEYLVNEFID